MYLPVYTLNLLIVLQEDLITTNSPSPQQTSLYDQVGLWEMTEMTKTPLWIWHMNGLLLKRLGGAP